VIIQYRYLSFKNFREAVHIFKVCYLWLSNAKTCVFNLFALWCHRSVCF